MERRRFLGTVAALAAVPLRSPNEKLNVAFIGTGGRGAANLGGLAPGNNVVALCDVDERRGGEAFGRFPGAKRFSDFRKMFDALGKGVDAVAISTPDHTHAVAAMEAIRRGIHVYCEKPLAHSMAEVRTLVRAAREKGVVTQLGNQGHSSESIRKCVEWVRDGAVGRVHTIHASCSSVHNRVKDFPLLAEKHEVPAGLDWDLWLGPAEERPYCPAYLPGKWRGWKPFGSGTIGDWVCHVVDPSFWALELGAPKSVEMLELDEYDPVKHRDTFPRGCTVRFEFAAKGGPVTLYWYSGSHFARKSKAEGVPEGTEIPDTGAVLLGDKGFIVHGSHGAGGLRLLPEERRKDYALPAPTIPRVGDHYKDFQAAIREGRKAGSDFSYGGPLTELAVLGIIAMNFPGRKLGWDGEAGRFTDSEDANRHLDPPLRKGWSL